MDNIITQSKLTDLWNQYNQVRVSGNRKTANKLLADYIDLLKNQDEEVIRNFVENICSLTLDTDSQVIANDGTDVSGKDIRIQHPLFKEIILPILKDQYKNDSAKHTKWIGQLEQFFYSDNITTKVFLEELNIEGHFETRHFFEKSFAIDNNQEVLALLLDRVAQDINYYTHEVPIGVLVTPEFLDKELMVFRKYWQQSNAKIVWNVVLREWELIATNWRIYISNQYKYDNFENYLKMNGIKFD